MSDIVYQGQTKRVLLSFTAYRTIGSVDSSTDTFTCNAHGFSNGDPVTFRATNGQLPTPLSAAATYYVVNKAANTFQVATSAGGTALDLTTVGGGVLEVSGPYDPDSAVRLLVKDPNDTVTTYTYAGSTVSKLAAGLYYKDYTYATTGTYQLRQEGDFTINGATYTEAYQWEVICLAKNTQ